MAHYVLTKSWETDEKDEVTKAVRDCDRPVPSPKKSSNSIRVRVENDAGETLALYEGISEFTEEEIEEDGLPGVDGDVRPVIAAAEKVLIAARSWKYGPDLFEPVRAREDNDLVAALRELSDVYTLHTH